MTTFEPQQLPPARHGDHDHEHAWRRVDDGLSVRTWAYLCEICHRTWAGFVS